MIEGDSTETSTWHKIHQLLAGSKLNFIQKLKNVETVQAQILSNILKNNQNTEFGNEYKFSQMSSVEDFTNSAPVHNYEACRPYLESIAAAEDENIVCFEKTGGSSRGCKLIPFNQKSLQFFKNALNPWFDDLLISRPGIKKGTAYWSISPALRDKQFTAGGHPIGLDNDALYFGEQLAIEIANSLAVSPQVSTIENLDQWRFQTLRDLLLAEDLNFISIWSPTFLLELISHLSEISEKLLAEIKKINPTRAFAIQPYLENQSRKNLSDNLARIWPQLDCISCWTDGAAASFIPALEKLFPAIHIQGKGLLATEGVITIPLSEAEAPVLAVDSGFYEFLDDSGKAHLAHQLEQGRFYTVLLTNESGLYRYCLGDKVRMEGYFHQAPMLKFIGRGEHSSDLCGEKLTDDFVVQALDDCSGAGELHFLFPQTQPHPHYTLVTEKDFSANDSGLVKLEKNLSENPQYQYARSVGQLGQLEHRIIRNAMQCYIQWNQGRGQSLGDIKPPVLVTDEGFIKELLSL